MGSVENAGLILDLAREHGSFRDYLRSLDGLDYRQRVKELTGLFRGLAGRVPSCSCTASTNRRLTGKTGSGEFSRGGLFTFTREAKYSEEEADTCYIFSIPCCVYKGD